MLALNPRNDRPQVCPGVSGRSEYTSEAMLTRVFSDHRTARRGDQFIACAPCERGVASEVSRQRLCRLMCGSALRFRFGS